MRTSLFALGFAARALAQTAAAYVDSNTGITFWGFTDSSSGFKYGMVMPETIGSDFIGQIVSSMPTMVVALLTPFRSSQVQMVQDMVVFPCQVR